MLEHPRHLVSRAQGTMAVLMAVMGLCAGPTAQARAADEPTHILTGAWERLPDLPGMDNLAISDATPLVDGRIAVTLWAQNTPHESCVVVYDSIALAWERPPLDPFDVCFGTDTQFALGPDGRLLGLVSVIDPSVEPWTIETALWRPSDPDEMGGPVVTLDGSAFLFELGVATRALGLDLTTGTTQPRSSIEGQFNIPIVGRADRVFAADPAFDGSRLAVYEPVSDSWTVDPDRVPVSSADWHRATVEATGWVYVPSLNPHLEAARLLAREPDSGEWLIVATPADLPDSWSPDLVDIGDGRLYAIDRLAPYVFTPGEIVPIPTPDPAPTEGGSGGLIPDTATSSPGVGAVEAVMITSLGIAAWFVVRGGYRRSRSSGNRTTPGS